MPCTSWRDLHEPEAAALHELEQEDDQRQTGQNHEDRAGDLAEGLEDRDHPEDVVEQPEDQPHHDEVDDDVDQRFDHGFDPLNQCAPRRAETAPISAMATSLTEPLPQAAASSEWAK